MSISTQSNQPDPTLVEQDISATAFLDNQESKPKANKSSPAAMIMAIIASVLAVISLGYAASVNSKVVQQPASVGSELTKGDVSVDEAAFMGGLAQEMGEFKQKTEERLDVLEQNLLDSTAIDTNTGYPLKYKPYIDAYTDEDGMLDMDGLSRDYPEVFADLISSDK